MNEPNFNNVLKQEISHILYYRDYLRSILFYCIKNDLINLLLKVFNIFIETIFGDNYKEIFCLFMIVENDFEYDFITEYNIYNENIYILKECKKIIYDYSKLNEDFELIYNIIEEYEKNTFNTIVKDFKRKQNFNKKKIKCT